MLSAGVSEMSLFSLYREVFFNMLVGSYSLGSASEKKSSGNVAVSSLGLCSVMKSAMNAFRTLVIC